MTSTASTPGTSGTPHTDTPRDPDRVLIFDTTLRDGEQSPGATMNFAQKLEVAHQLARLGVDVIEAGFPVASIGDFESVQAIAEQVRGPVIAGLARSVEGDIARVAEAVKHAARPRIHTFLATSPIHREKKLRKTKDEIIAMAAHAVGYARSLVVDVEFSCEDASRTEPDFLVDVVTAAIESGATTINLPDTVGYANPWQYGDLVAHVIAKVPQSHRAVFSVHCHDDMGNATANSLAGVRAGARQIECTINGIGERAGNTSLEEVVMNLVTRKDYFGVHTGIVTTEITRSSRLVVQVTGIRVPRNKAIVGANAFAHESGIHQDGMLKDATTYEIMTPESVGWTGEGMVLGKHSGRHAFKTRLRQLGYADIPEDRLTRAFDRFKDLCDKKKDIYDEDLYAIVEDESAVVEAVWELDYLGFSSGTGTVPTATVTLSRGDHVQTDAATGDGPVDAALRAIQRIVGMEAPLREYSLEAVSEGMDAVGQVALAVATAGRIIKARSADTDVVVASVKAYLKAINIGLTIPAGLVPAERVVGV